MYTLYILKTKLVAHYKLTLFAEGCDIMFLSSSPLTLCTFAYCTYMVISNFILVVLVHQALCFLFKVLG